MSIRNSNIIIISGIVTITAASMLIATGRYGYNNNNNNCYYGYNNEHRDQNGPANGQVMIDPKNPNLFRACDSDGHHCHWKPRR